MVAPSKLFDHPLKNLHCSQVILHPGIGCIRHYLNTLLINGLSGLKYFSPLLITPLVLKYKSMNRQIFMQTVNHYLQTVIASTLATASAQFCICCLRNLLGDFRTYTTLFLPTVLGLQFCWFFPTRVLKLFTTATSQAALEGLLLQYSNKLTHLILYSPIVQTILFMLNSAIILHYKRKNIYKDFWFIQPHEKLNHHTEQTILGNGEKEDIKISCKKFKTKCNHKNVTCFQFLLDGIKTHVCYGLALDLLSMVMGGKLNRPTQTFKQKVFNRLTIFRPIMTGFFISYISIYRLSCCLLRKYFNHLSLDRQHLLAAFFGGFSFAIVKRVNFITLSLVISMQLLWQQFCSSINTEKSSTKSNVVLMMLKNVPMSQIVFSINCGYLAHHYLLDNRLVNNLAKGFLDGLNHNKLHNWRNEIINNDVQFFIEMAKKHSIKTFL